MVRQFPGKGRGIMAARDIKMGEEFMKSLKEQIESLPTEAK